MTTKIKKSQSTKDIIAAAYKRIQRSNTWTQGSDLKYETLKNGKDRACFCARGALRMAIRNSHDPEEATLSLEGGDLKKYERAQRALIQTLQKNPKKYGRKGEFNAENDLDLYEPLVDFNDSAGNHSQVARLFRDTVDRLS